MELRRHADGARDVLGAHADALARRERLRQPDGVLDLAAVELVVGERRWVELADPCRAEQVLFVDLPIAILFFATNLIELLFLRNPLILAVYNLCRRASQLPYHVPTLPDTESGLHARERSRANTNDGWFIHT